MSLFLRRVRRLAGRGSPGWAAHAVRREVVARREEVVMEAALRSRSSLLVGPFIGEVGYELLYWRPLVHRLLRSRQVDPERVTIVTRGGAGAWYRDVAARSIDVFELISPEELRTSVEERAVRTGQRKQMAVEAFDRELIGRVLERIGPAKVIHPRLMYERLRFLWEQGMRPAGDALRLADYDDLPRTALPAPIEERLPVRFAAAKLYFNEALEATPRVLEQLGEVVAAAAHGLPVVLLEAGSAVDDHDDWRGAIDAVPIADRLEPASNLAVQAEVAARAEVLIATYGGFSYVGPLVGTPTLAVWSQAEANERHEGVLRAVRPAASYERLRLGDDPAPTLARLAQAVGAS